MEIISHRGLWNIKVEKNSLQSFIDSFKKGFGTETDIRDLNGRLVISHDTPILNSNLVYFEDFLEIYVKWAHKRPILALNIKSDGLNDLVKKQLNDYNIENYFTFDMSVPDQLNYMKSNLKVFTRQSEFENFPILYQQTLGIWLDSFHYNWYSTDLINEHFINDKLVCIVSSELHNRDKYELWEFLKVSGLFKSEKLFLCTDFPEECINYFNRE